MMSPQFDLSDLHADDPSITVEIIDTNDLPDEAIVIDVDTFKTDGKQIRPRDLVGYLGAVL